MFPLWPIIQSTPQSLKQHMRSRPEPSKNTNIQTQIQKYKQMDTQTEKQTNNHGKKETNNQMYNLLSLSEH